ncbi:MAG TPA: gluconate 2-dehydrogenase subunit 3 family protein, partial [Povalibacter sp.]|nr:gluconate 2-dehydrogenase subunit 3 family protein [Povalibacter sp.]
MSSGILPRRSFLLFAGSTVSALWLSVHGQAIADAAHHADAVADGGVSGALSFFNDHDAADVTAIAACIIPGGATPGAREAHVIVFIDRALQTFFSDRAAQFREGLTQLQAAFAAAHPGIAFASASDADQVAFLRTVENTPFFGGMTFMTVMGFLSSPKYGGNAQKLGWKAIGFEDQHIFTP